MPKSNLWRSFPLREKQAVSLKQVHNIYMQEKDMTGEELGMRDDHMLTVWVAISKKKMTH